MNLTDQFLNFTLLGAEWVLWLLVLLSIFSVAIMVERGLFLYRRSLNADAFVALVRKAVANQKTDDFIKKHKDAENMAAQTVMAGLAQIDGGVEAVSEAMNGEKSRQQRLYGQNLVVLGTLGNNAPFIGLFGTVLGIIKAFQDLEDNPAGGIEVVMSSLSEALVATAVGLLVAIPAVIAFNYFNRRTHAAVTATDSAAHALLSTLHAAETHAAETHAAETSKKSTKSGNKGEDN